MKVRIQYLSFEITAYNSTYYSRNSGYIRSNFFYQILCLLAVVFLAGSDGFVLIDTETGHIIEAFSPNVEELKSEMEFYDNEDTEDNQNKPGLMVLTPKKEVHVPAPEYLAQDGQTPIYQIRRKHPYGR